MAIGDKVRVSGTYMYSGNENIPIYTVEVGPDNKYVVDLEGCGMGLKVIGGVKPNSTGTIDGHPVKAYRKQLIGYEKVTSLGVDTVMLFPVLFDHYQRVGWVPSDYLHMTDGHQLDFTNNR